MLVTRWQAPIVPDRQQIKMMFEAEGLDPYEEVFPAQSEVGDHRHAFDEVRMVCSGELLVNIAGNKLLLRAGDKIKIPANTRHSTKTDGTSPCVSLYAQKIF